jgi:hypothetical protein
VDPRAELPVVKALPVTRIRYAAADATDLKRFSAVHAASAGLITTSVVRSISVAGRDVGVVGVYRVRRGLAKSTAFQDQYAVQVLGAVTGSHAAPRLVRTKDGGVLVLSTGKAAVAAWFKDDQLTLVYRDGRSPDLAALAAAVRALPPGR